MLQTACVLSLLASLTTSPGASDTGGSLDAFTAHLDERVPELMRRARVPGLSLAIVRSGEVVWSNAYGHADLSQDRPMTVDAVCRVESISKSLTVWGVLRLVEQGRIQLDEPVQRYLRTWRIPESDYSEDAITVRRLLSQTAGLPLGTIGIRYAPGETIPTLREVLSREARLVREPGTSFAYSNVGFNLLELVIEEVTGRDFAEYMAAEVLMPLGMRDSSFSWSESLRSRIPTGYDLRGDPVPVYLYPERASGGLFATVEDVARFVAAESTGVGSSGRAVLSPAGLRALASSQAETGDVFGVVSDAYGFGHFLETLPDGRRALWHGGQGTGWMTHFHAVPASGDGIVILTNSQRSWPLMAEVLSDWARWSGSGSVKMGRIAYGTAGLRALVAVVLLMAGALLLRLGRRLYRGERAWAPLSPGRRAARLLQAGVAVGTLGLLAWCSAQPYLMVSSVFPTLAGRAGLAFSVLAAALLLSALCPKNGADRFRRPSESGAHPAESAAEGRAQRPGPPE